MTYVTVKSQRSLAQSFAIKHNGNMNCSRDMYIINSGTYKCVYVYKYVHDIVSHSGACFVSS